MQQGLGHMPQMHPALPTALPAGMHHHPGLPQIHGLNPAAMMNLGISPAVANQVAAANMAAAAARMPSSMAQSGCVILVSNLEEEVCSN